MGMKFMIAEVTYGDCICQDCSIFNKLKALVEVWEDDGGTRFEIKDEDFTPFYNGEFQKIKETLDKELVEVIENVKKQLDKATCGYITIELWL